MNKERELFDIGDIEDALTGNSETPQSTTIKIQDASSETALILVPNMGSDKEILEQGKVDWRRFTHLDMVDPFWMAYLKLMPKERGGGFASQFVEEYGNLAYSVSGRHKKLAVDFQKAVSGDRGESKKPKKKRSLTDKLLGRNKDEDE